MSPTRRGRWLATLVVVASVAGSTSPAGADTASRGPSRGRPGAGVTTTSSSTSTSTTVESSTVGPSTTTTTTTATTVASATSTSTPVADATTTATTTTAVTSTTATATARPVRHVSVVGATDVAFGFAERQGLTGGIAGASYVVTSTADSGPGTYRDALARGDRYVTFDPSLRGATIALRSPVLTAASNITVDGAGSGVVIADHATKFSGTNVVVAGMTFRGNAATTAEDAITFRSPSRTQVFGLFHNTFESAADGLVDVIWNDGHDVYGTVCGNRFAHHDKAVLIHSGDATREGGTYHVTFCRNHWVDVFQRAPLSRDALVHQYNDVFERYGDAVGAGGGSKSGAGTRPSQHLLEGNIAVPRARGERTWTGVSVTTPRSEFAGPHASMLGHIRIDGSLLMRGADGAVTATQKEYQRDSVFAPPYDRPLLTASAPVRRAVAAAAGRCEPASDGRRHVNPCTAVLPVASGGDVTVRVDGDATAVRLELDGRLVGRATSTGTGTWTATLDPTVAPAGTVGRLVAVVTDADGGTVASAGSVLVVVPT